jgi:hypothetical protein
LARFLLTEEKIALALLWNEIIAFKFFGSKAMAQRAPALLFALRFVEKNSLSSCTPLLSHKTIR